MKKVLIITYYWPPAGGPGVQRWLKFVKYLPDFNIEPIVFIPENASYPMIDADLEKDVSKNLVILKQPIKEPYKWASYFSKNNTKSISSGIIKPTKKQSLTEKKIGRASCREREKSSEDDGTVKKKKKNKKEV